MKKKVHKFEITLRFKEPVTRQEARSHLVNMEVGCRAIIDFNSNTATPTLES